MMGKKISWESSLVNLLAFSKLSCGNSSASAVNETDADGSGQTRNCLASNCHWKPSASSTAATAAFSIKTKKSESQQERQELIQLQKQQIQQMQLTGIAEVEAPASNNSSYSLIGSNFPNNNPIFLEALVHHNTFLQSSNWNNASFAATSQVPSSLAATSSLKTISRQELRITHGQNQISFGSSLNSFTRFPGQQIVINRQGTSATVDRSPSNSSPSKNTGGISSKARGIVAAVPPQQTETSSDGPSQKPSPVCGRNVPSILSTCPSQLPELKF